MLLDLSPLRDSHGFRLVFIARTTSLLVYGILSVALGVQVFDLTGSSLAVAWTSVAVTFPMAAALIWGGILADRHDRRKLLIWSRTAYLASIAILILNALLPDPPVWPIYLAGAIGGLTSGISIPALMAVTPALVGRDRLAAAAALTAITVQIGAIAGPFLAGLLIAGPGLVACYAVVAIGTGLTPILLSGLPSLPPNDGGKTPMRSLAAFGEGLRYLAGRPILISLLAVDVAAMVFAMPFALLPELGSVVFGGGPQVVGALYAAPAVGALIAATTSGWTSRTSWPGWSLVVSVVLWGAAIVGLGLSAYASATLAALTFLALMGFADTVSEILRGALLQRHTEDGMLGRVTSLWMMQATVSPALGNAQIGFVARLFSPGFALIAGGALCMAGAGMIGWAFPSLRRARLRDADSEPSGTAGNQTAS